MLNRWEKVLLLSHHPSFTLLLSPTCRAPRETAPMGDINNRAKHWLLWFMFFLQVPLISLHNNWHLSYHAGPKQTAGRSQLRNFGSNVQCFAHKSRSPLLWFIGCKGRRRKALHYLSRWGSPNTSRHQSTICLRIYGGFAIVQARETVILFFKQSLKLK